MATLFTQQDETFFNFDDNVSPTTALFPLDLSAPYDNALLNLPLGHRLSISASSDGLGSSNLSYLSRPNSLSPSSQVPSLQPAPSDLSSRSPHSSASPNSTFSFSANEDFLAPSLSANELDMLFQSNDLQQPGGKSGQFFFPDNSLNANYSFGNMGINQLDGSSQSTYGHDDTFDMLNLVENSPIRDTRRYSVISTESYPVQPSREHQIRSLQHRANIPAPASLGVTPSVLQQQSSPQAPQRQHQQHHQHQQPQSLQTLPPQWVNQMQADVNSWARVKQEATQSVFPQQTTNYLYGTNELDSAPQISVRRSAASKAPASRPASNKRQLKSDSDSPPAGPALGKHNKTERRYRQKVQAAQADLRDSVPALRVLYGTSSEEQRHTTDVRAPDGTIDGLGEIGRPNASAKTTIFLGARMYIELLQQRVATLQRKVGELEEFRVAVEGEQAFQHWSETFDAQENERIALETLSKVEDESFSEEDEEEVEDEPKRKKTKAAPKPKGGKKVKTEDADFGPGGPSAGGNGVRVFAAFAMSFSLLPSASTLFKQASVDTDSASQVYSGTATSSEVISRLPLIAAEHTSRLLARTLPQAVVPHPNSLVDWTWRLLVAVVLAVLLGPLFSRWSPARVIITGKSLDIARDTAKLALRSKEKDPKVKLECSKVAAEILGDVSPASPMFKLHAIIRLSECADDAYSLALLALLQPSLPFVSTSDELWKSARGRIAADTPASVIAVLALPLEEALRCLKLVPRTTSPIAAMAEQITLVHVNDLFSRLFVRLVDASTRAGVAPPVSIKALLDNLESKSISTDLKSSSFDKEIRGVVEGVPKGSVSHALGLVLIGLWGVFTGPIPTAQAALASALAAEELQGSGAGLESVSAMLDLLYPGSSTTALDRVALSSALPQNALAIDRLALVCISYIRLLASANQLNDQSTRLQRLEASRSVQKATSHLRFVLTQTTFVGLDESEETDEEDREEKVFELAKERLVGVLSTVGRRASGRALGRDEDSGLEGDLDEI